MLRGAIIAAAVAFIIGCSGIGCTGPTQPTPTGATATLAASVPAATPTPVPSSTLAATPAPVLSSTPPAGGQGGAGSIVYIAQSNVWLATPLGTAARQLTTDGTEADSYHDPSQADDGTIFVLKGERALYRLDHAGNPLGAPVTLVTLENGAEGLAAARDGTRVAYVTVGSGTYVDPRFGTPSGTFLYGGTDVANLDGTSVPGAVLPSLIFPSWGDDLHLLVSDGVDLYVDEVGQPEPQKWLSLTEGCITDFDCPAGQQAAASISTPMVSHDGRVVAYGYKPYFGPAGRRLATLTAAPPVLPQTRCVIPGQENHSDPGTFSGDSSLFVYDDTRFDPDAFETVVGEGIWVFPIDLDAADCGASSARLIVHGGSQPDWGPAAP
jgi:hypothetical protein